MDFAEKVVQNSRNSTGKVRKLEKNNAKRRCKWPKLEKNTRKLHKTHISAEECVENNKHLVPSTPSHASTQCGHTQDKQQTHVLCRCGDMVITTSTDGHACKHWTTPAPKNAWQKNVKKMLMTIGISKRNCTDLYLTAYTDDCRPGYHIILFLPIINTK